MTISDFDRLELADDGQVAIRGIPVDDIATVGRLCGGTGALLQRFPFLQNDEIKQLLTFISMRRHPEIRALTTAEHVRPVMTNGKDRAEAWILLDFLRAARINPQSSPKKLQPPQPDLSCVIRDEIVLFELGEVLESSLGEGLACSETQSFEKQQAQAQGDYLNAASKQTVGTRSFPANRTLHRLLREKLNRQYETNGHRAHLVLYFDRQWPWGPFNYLAQFRDELRGLLKGSKFQRIWLFHADVGAVIGSVALARTGDLLAFYDSSYDFDFDGTFDALVPSGGREADKIKPFKLQLTRVKK